MIVTSHFRTVARADPASATVMLTPLSCVAPEAPGPMARTGTTTISDAPDPTIRGGSGSGLGANSAIPAGWTTHCAERD